MTHTKKVLVVEDEEPLCNAIVAALQKSGYEALAAHDGNEGLKIALEHHPDLIILDHLMPAKSGLSMLKELRKDEWGSTVAVIMTTNVGETDNVNRALMQNVQQYIIKSDISLDEIVASVNETLGLDKNTKEPA